MIFFVAVDRRRCAEIYLRKQHLVEEREILSNEMKNCLQFCYKKVESLSNDFKNICEYILCFDFLTV